MRKKQPIAFSQKFPNVDPLALRLLERLLAFDPKDRPTAEEVKFVIVILHQDSITCATTSSINHYWHVATCICRH